MNVETPKEINPHRNTSSSAKKYGDDPKNVFSRAWQKSK